MDNVQTTIPETCSLMYNATLVTITESHSDTDVVSWLCPLFYLLRRYLLSCFGALDCNCKCQGSEITVPLAEQRLNKKLGCCCGA